MSELLESPSFNEVRKTVNNVPQINRGGCGIAALALIRWIRKNKPEEIKHIKMCFMYERWSEEQEIKSNRRWVKGQRKTPYIPSHIMLTYKGVLFDSKVVGDSYGYVMDPMPSKVLLNAINFNGWNHNFKRRKNVRELGRKLSINMNDVRVTVPYAW